MADSNPNGANQHVEDPRKEQCWSYYIDIKSETYSNGYQSAMRAGYEESYAATITTQEWFKEKIRKNVLVAKAEKNLDKLLDSKDERIQADMTKFALSTLEKEHYSTRTENTGKGGKDLNPTFVVATKDSKELLEKLYEGSDSSND